MSDMQLKRTQSMPQLSVGKVEKTQPSETTTQTSTPSPSETTGVSNPKAFKRSQSQSSLLDAPDLEKSLSTTVPVRNRLLVPTPGMLNKAKQGLTPTVTSERSGTEAIIKDLKANVGALIDPKGFGSIEQSLRSTAFKWNSTVKGLMSQARQEARTRVENHPESELLKTKLLGSPAMDIKQEIARSIGALRGDKYGDQAGYYDLSPNKRALVDAIYKGMMEACVSSKGNLGSDIAPKGEVLTPGVRATLSRDLIVDGVSFKKGEKCVMLERGGEVFIQKIGPKKDDKGKVITGKDAEMVIYKPLHKLGNPKDVKPGNQTFKKTDAPLFEGPVSVKDVRQGAIGDCFLIAGIYEIAARNPQAIHDMMRDNGDGTVTVRLFSKDVNGELKPKAITFEKSTLSTDEHAEDALWVQMLEKAYAIEKGSYVKLNEGGYSHKVFETLLGIKSERDPMKPGTAKFEELIKTLPETSMSLQALAGAKDELMQKGLTKEQVDSLSKVPHELLMNIKNKNDLMQIEALTGVSWSNLYEKETAFAQVNKKDVPALTKAMQEYNVEKAKRAVLYDALSTILSNKDRNEAIDALMKQSPSYQKNHQQRVIFKEDVETMIGELRELAKRQPDFVNQGKTFRTSDLVDALEAEVGKSSFPKRDTEQGIDYTKTQNDFFQHLQTSLAQGKYIAVGTPKDIGKSQGTGHSGGESMVDGLAGRHAYAVLDVVEMNGRKFVRIANPWGNDYSRDYSVGKDGSLESRRFKSSRYDYLPPTPERQGAGIGINESWIELRELCTTFNSVYSSK